MLSGSVASPIEAQQAGDLAARLTGAIAEPPPTPSEGSSSVSAGSIFNSHADLNNTSINSR
jgi:hypothetical protein